MENEYTNYNLPEDGTYHYRADQLHTQPQWEQLPPRRKKKNKGWTPGRIIALTLCASLISGALGAGGTVLLQRIQKADSPAFTQPGDTSQMLESVRENAKLEIVPVSSGELMTPAQVYAANVNSTVGITTSVTTNFWGYQTTSAAAGSGFILTEDGYILTNYPVIENSDTISVSCYNGDTYDAALIGYDESNDIAVLKVEAQGLSPVVLGSSDKTNVGDSVLAIGNPLGELTFSLTAGTVSALDRQVTMSTGVTMNLIQTDCAINSGNSGGALFNLYGEVVGITNAKYSSSSSGEASIDNIGFAIPIDDVRGIIQSIIEKGYISKPYIGVSVTDVSAETQSYGLPAGAAVQSVTENSPAAQAGIMMSDIITQVDGADISGSGALVDVITDARVGQQLQLKVYRQGSYLDITVTVGEQIRSAMEEPVSTPSQQFNFDPWGR